MRPSVGLFPSERRLILNGVQNVIDKILKICDTIATLQFLKERRLDEQQMREMRQ
jgi:hypothetical protein